MADEDPTPDTPTTVEDWDLIKARWKNRRQMAWTSLVLVFVLVQQSIYLATRIPEAQFKILVEVLTTGIFVFGVLVGAYMGLATLAESSFWGAKKK
jgi:hypothetical protein